MELWQRIGDLPLKLVQFPQVLLLRGLLFDAIGLFGRDRRFHWAAAILSRAGTLFLLVASMCGISAEISAGTHALLLFRLPDRGQPVTDLEPYMGAMGHCAILSQDTATFLHCHPEQLYPPRRDARGGPDIAFHAMFPRPGLYKVWGQFQRGGKVVVADFVMRVGSSLLPPRVVNFILNEG